MVNYPPRPRFKITTNYGGSSYVFENEKFLSGQIIRVENGFDTATLHCSDYKSKNFLAKIDAGEDIKIEFKDESDASWTTELDGIVRFINTPFSIKGELLEIKCDGAGYGFGETACAEEYGNQSANPSLDTLKEIITDSTNGIVPKWVNSILGSVTSSGYNYSMTKTVANDLIEAIAGAIRYLYYPYKPCNKALQDLCDLVQAIKGAAAGPHWIVTTSDKLIVSTIGAHHAEAVAEGWTNYYGGSQAKATLEQGIDFTQFFFQKLAKEANYILYAGAFRKPPNGDIWTNLTASSWGTSLTGAGGSDCTMSDENGTGLFKVGSHSIEAYGDTAGGLFEFYYPSSKDLSLDLTKIGGEYNIPTISFWCQINSNVENNSIGDLQILLLKYVDAADIQYFRCCFGGWDEPVSGNFHGYIGENEWYHVTLPIGPYAQSAHKDFEDWIAGNLAGAGTMSWSDVDAVFFFVKSKDAQRGKIYIDGLCINGYVLRGARETTIDATNPLKLKVITDDEAKDDTLTSGTPGTTDVGTMARMAYAELLRCKSTPYIATFTTPIIMDLLPGQLVYVKAKKKSDGSFNIQKDFRLTKLIHEFAPDPKGFLTHHCVTDDVTNANARQAFTDLNKILADMRPEFQDRQATSIKTREIDITQAILEESY